jgi:hypothetical protein
MKCKCKCGSQTIGVLQALYDLVHGFHNLATWNIKLEQTMNIAFNDINDIKLNVDINILATIQSQ